MYQLTHTTQVLHLQDAMYIPQDELATDWQAYQAWLSAGGVPLPADPPKPLSPLEQIRQLEQASADKQARMTRVSLLALAIDKGRVIGTIQMTALANGLADQQGLDASARAALVAQYVSQLTDEFIHAKLMALDSGYKAMHELEQQIEALRSLL